MFNAVKLMKIFEVAWLTIAAISFIMGVYQLLFQPSKSDSFPYLFLICGLAIMMFFVKRGSRKFIEKRKSQENSQS